MFELSIALKYLTPRWRQLSVSIISLISILVIALVVWLIVVFFSVTHGLEKSWIQKLTALTSPVRITPTEAYYHSYYYNVDSLSAASDYNSKTIGEKLRAAQTDPYDPMEDGEPPSNWNVADRDAEGNVKDIVKKAFHAINTLSTVPGISARDFEMSVGNLRLRLVRNATGTEQNQTFLSQSTYLGSLDPENSSLTQALLPLTMDDLNNVLKMLPVGSNNIQEDNPEALYELDHSIIQEKLRQFFNSVDIQSLKTPAQGWNISPRLLPALAQFQAVAVVKGNRITRLVIPQNTKDALKLKTELGPQASLVQITWNNGEMSIEGNGISEKPAYPVPLIAEGGLAFPATLLPASLNQAIHARDVHFKVELTLQGSTLQGEVPFGNLVIDGAKIIPKQNAPWLTVVPTSEALQITLPSDPHLGDGIILPKGFKDSNALVGDRGYLSYFAPTTSSIQEQRLPIYVAGFYDPGIIPIGGKLVIANQEVTSLIRSSHGQEDASNGINVRFDNLDQADHVKNELLAAFEREGIAPYWRIETFREYEFTKDLLQQLRSERNLWTLIATVIIIVACSNIISMLIILVNDKKLEIGILRSMGATALSIATIFGTCGMAMGMIGSILGTLIAVFTLHHLQSLVNFISRLQGYDVFNPVYYGNSLPSEISLDALIFVIVATSIISLLAGIIPAAKASMLRPSIILRSE